MPKQDIICVCPACLEGIRGRIRLAFAVERRPLGIFTTRVIAGLGWVPPMLYSHLFNRMVETGELVKFTPDNPNQPTRYLHYRLMRPVGRRPWKKGRAK
jgi:hypothetical protein